ncbi:hypothetical protein [Mesobacillus maritimus]|uniref:Uncharacterized protein n=1 Tax=Mesobacillus maritimus TaxID=1643336 RepID=A0ABS7KBY9_9BACI|nr:hypothetical protein [Mesobacillus maritimus]MBY0099605.1 hypothetical protein [Mesobacillus maritimus]
MGKKITNGKKNKNRSRKEIFGGLCWRIFPFLFFILAIAYIAVLGNGYKMFEKLGWNPNIVLFIRYLDNLLLMLIPLTIALVLLWKYIQTWKTWVKEVEKTSMKSRTTEILWRSVIFLVPSCILILVAIQLGLGMLQSPDSYWKEEWDLK